MSTIKINDKGSLSLSFPTDPGSTFAKYLRSPDSISLVLQQKQPAPGVLSQFVPSGISFDAPVKLGSNSDELTIKAGLQGTITPKTGVLFDPEKDDFGDSVTILPGMACLSVGFTATVEAGLTEKSGDLKFGIDATSSASLTNYRLFSASEAISTAVEKVLEDFVLPGDLQDIDGMEPGTIATVVGNGSIKFTAKGTFPVFSNPLASVATGPLNTFKANAGGSLSLTVTGGLSGGYQLRIRRLDGHKFELGYLQKRGSSLSVTAQAQVGVSGSIAGFDVIAALMKAISKDPAVDKDTFKKQTGLTDDQIDSIAAAVKAGIDRSLAASISEELDLSRDDGAAFSYQIDLNTIGDEGKVAVNDALSGDLSSIEANNYAGITPIRSVFTSVRDRKTVFKVNLLGIYNFGSVTELLKNGRLIVDRDTGAINVCDKVTASHIGFTSDNFAANGAKLRAITAAGVTITAAYKVAGALSGSESVTCSCWSFNAHQQTAISNMQHYLEEANAVQVISDTMAADLLRKLSGVPSNQVGASSFTIQSDYDSSAFRGMFLDGAGQPRPRAAYEAIGRSASVALLMPDDNTAVYRKKVLTDDVIWSQAAEAGDAPNIIFVLKEHGIPEGVANAIWGDVVLVLWWASAMDDMAKALAKLEQFLQSQPTPDPENNDFKKLRKQLDKAMASVATNTHNRFGEPWGLQVMAQASGMKDSTTATLVNSFVAFTASRKPQLAGKAATAS